MSIQDTEEELEEEMRIEIENDGKRDSKDLQMNSRKIQTVKYKSKIWVQDSIGKLTFDTLRPGMLKNPSVSSSEIQSKRLVGSSLCSSERATIKITLSKEKLN